MLNLNQALLLCLLALCACSKRPPAVPAIPEKETGEGPGAQPLIAAGDLTLAPIHFEFAIYYLPTAKGDPVAVLDKVLVSENREIQHVAKSPGSIEGPCVLAKILTDVPQSYRPPSTESLGRFGRGLSKEQAEGLQKSQQALVLDFVGPKEQASDHLRMACRIASDVARDTGGLLWDEETREVYTPEAWDQRRLEGWEGGAPFILNHIVIHAYSKGEYVRAITLGMAKFGVPDVVVENFSWGSNKNIGNIINLFAQALAEGAKIERLGEYDLDLHAIGNKEARDLHLKSLLDHAVAKAQLTLREGVREEGDPENRLVELGFDRYAGRDVHARQDAMISTLFGWRDAIKSVKPDTELNAASQRAKNQLPALKKVFNEGMAPGEFIQVKAPFGPAGDGREFMWVEVIAWESEKIKGLLKNEPFHIPSLHGGQIVEVEQKDVFDYIRHFADGRQTGNETGAILEKLDGIEEKR